MELGCGKAEQIFGLITRIRVLLQSPEKAKFRLRLFRGELQNKRAEIILTTKKFTIAVSKGYGMRIRVGENIN